jgi:hypothetical protein
MKYIHMIIAYFRRLFAAPQRTPVKRRQVRKRREETNNGEWTFKNSILDCLDNAHIIAKRLKKASPRAYKEYNREGAVLPSQESTFVTLGQFDVPIDNLPSFGSVIFSGDRELSSDRVSVGFISFTKLDRLPPGVEQTNGISFELAIYYDTGDAKYGHCLVCHASVAEDGNIRVLREVYEQKQTIRHHDNTNTRLTHQRVGVPPMVAIIAEEKGETVNEWVGNALRAAVNSYLLCAGGIKISAQKMGIRSTFNVDMTRSAYFFADREPVFADEGHKKRIFHYVRSFVRVNGAKVRSHFRGLRDFTWNGYRVRVSVPGYNEGDMALFNVSAKQFNDDEEEGAGMIDVAKVVQYVEERGGMYG